MTRLLGRGLGTLISLLYAAAISAQTTDKPNILVIWGDDIGMDNISAYTMGQAGHWTPNIDRIAREGVIFTDSYGENSCTAGRSAFITGQHPMRTGLTKVGMPGAAEGISEEDPTIATMLKPLGYVSGQFGKNHLGDRDEHLPTNHGFDTFFGNLYHLNAEEEPENEDYNRIMSPELAKRFSPRGVIHSWADGKVEDTGALTRRRMEIIDEEFLAEALTFIDKAHAAKKPFFVWFNSTRMHVWTHLKDESKGRSLRGGLYGDGMMEHDQHVGRLLDKLDELGIADNTVVFYSTDNGAEKFSWPDGGTARFRGEKNSTWEGGFRVPAMVRWPGKIPAGNVVNEMVAHNDWAPTLLAAAGNPDIKQQLLDGTTLGERRYRVHLDGFNLLPKLMEGKNTTADDNSGWPRKTYIYSTDGGDVAAIRMGDWKILYMYQNCIGIDTWRCPLETGRAPMVFNLRQDPYEDAPLVSGSYEKWSSDRMYIFAPAVAQTVAFLRTFDQFPPRQIPGDWTISKVVKQLKIWERAAAVKR